MPIDIASGTVHISFEDALIRGKVNLVWDRHYSGSLLTRPGVGLGPGWITGYHAKLVRQTSGFEFVTPTGSVEFLSDPERTVENGAVLREFGAHLEVFMHAGRYVIRSWGRQAEVRSYTFIPAGPSGPMDLASIEDISGRGLDFQWDDNGRLLAVRQRIEQRELRVGYDQRGLLTTLDLRTRGGASHRLARYEYNDSGQLSAALDALGYAQRYEYDGNGRLSRELAKDGGVFSYRYDRQDRCVWTSGLEHYDEKRLRFLDSARITEVTDSYGSTWRYQYLPTGQITNEWNPLGAETKTEYDLHGRIVSRTTPMGAVTRYTHDESGNLSGITDPAGATYSISYNQNHQPTVVIDPVGGVWRRHYDARGYLVRMENALGRITAWEYDANGNQIAATAPDGATTQFRYREDGTLHQVVDPTGATRSFLFDDLGHPSMQINPMGGVVQAEYDAAGRVVEVRRPDGTALKYQYDAGGNIIQKTDGRGYTTQYEWGSCGRLRRKTDPLGRTISYEWGTEIDRLLAVINEIGESLSLSYDAAGRIVEERSFDGLVKAFAYNLNGELVRYAIGDKDSIEFLYDPCGRPAERRASDGALEQFEYDPFGRLVVARNADCIVEYQYDPLGNVISERQNDATISTSFDDANRMLRRRTSLGFDARFSWDGNGRPVKIDLFGDNSFAFAYDPAGSEVSRSLPGGLRLAQNRDDRGRVIRQFLASSSVRTTDFEIAGFLNGAIARSFHYDGNSAPLNINDRRIGNAAYTYDPAEQLLSADYASRTGEKFDYTPTGGLSTAASPNGSIRLVYGQGNRLLRAGGSNYDYDVSGRRSRKTLDTLAGGSWIYAWDSLGRLRSVTAPSGAAWTYTYDALGRRIIKAGPEGTTRFVWSGDTMVHAIGSSGAVESWLFDDATLVPVAKAEHGQVYPVIPDHLGVPRELIDRSGAIVWSTTLSAWGEVVSPNHPKVDCPIRFPGQWFDAESGLHYNRYRYFDPEIGQFISQDPLGIDGGLNVYRYAPNPLNYRDLLGLDICANRKKGEDFKNAVKDELEKAGLVVVDEVTIKVNGPNGSVRTRVDLLVMDQNGNPVLIETKASATAPYTPNQTAAGVPTGTLSGPAEYRTDKGGLDRGSAVPTSATTVTVRPGDPIPLTGPPPVTAPYPPPP